MKYSGFCSVLASICFLATCKPPKVTVPSVFANQYATLMMVPCSRGCEQYVIKTDGSESTTLYVVNMPDSLSIRVVPSSYNGRELPVVFSGKRSDESEQISVADANDVPQPAYKAYRLQLTALRRR
ncbi:MAG: hypothetical protein JWP57_2561 [Spirosoma sp.]|nr:hypothetical protein [Spirosoma sp.]